MFNTNVDYRLYTAAHINPYERTQWSDMSKAPYHYIIFTGPRCKGLKSNATYDTKEGALKAGKTMMKKLGLGVDVIT